MKDRQIFNIYFHFILPCSFAPNKSFKLQINLSNCLMQFSENLPNTIKLSAILYLFEIPVEKFVFPSLSFIMASLLFK